MAWPFRCESPDFTARSIPDDTTFNVKRQCLMEGSELFTNMFADCADQEQSMDLPETANALTVLFRLLHEPPALFKPVKPTPAKAFGEDPRADLDTSSIIPLPVIPIALDLADKYMLKPDLIKVLHSHIGAHVITEPLKVYGLAVSLGLPELASDASEYLLHPPLSTYSTTEMKAIPTVEALHQLIRLHGIREARLREVLLGEAIFPHDYGMCPTHGTATTALWEKRKQALAPRVRAGTDVASEMADISGGVGSCKVCTKACNAAVDMLAYKCKKVIRKIHQLPKEE